MMVNEVRAEDRAAHAHEQRGATARIAPPMMSWFGIAIAGMLNGTFAVPMKTALTWKFSHIWAIFSLVAMLFIPWIEDCATNHRRSLRYRAGQIGLVDDRVLLHLRA
jgi:hypothetical protein